MILQAGRDAELAAQVATSARTYRTHPRSSSSGARPASDFVQPEHPVCSVDGGGMPTSWSGMAGRRSIFFARSRLAPSCAPASVLESPICSPSVKTAGLDSPFFRCGKNIRHRFLTNNTVQRRTQDYRQAIFVSYRTVMGYAAFAERLFPLVQLSLAFA